MGERRCWSFPVAVRYDLLRNQMLGQGLVRYHVHDRQGVEQWLCWVLWRPCGLHRAALPHEMHQWPYSRLCNVPQGGWVRHCSVREWFMHRFRRTKHGVENACCVDAWLPRAFLVHVSSLWHDGFSLDSISLELIPHLPSSDNV